MSVPGEPGWIGSLVGRPSRPTVYRYLTSAEALLLAAASDGVNAFLADITAATRAGTHCQTLADLAE